MSFPVEQSSEKLISDVGSPQHPATNSSSGGATHNLNHTHSLVGENSNKDNPPHDVITSNQLEDTKNLPPGSSITR